MRGGAVAVAVADACVVEAMGVVVGCNEVPGWSHRNLSGPDCDAVLGLRSETSFNILHTSRQHVLNALSFKAAHTKIYFDTARLPRDAVPNYFSRGSVPKWPFISLHQCSYLANTFDPLLLLWGL